MPQNLKAIYIVKSFLNCIIYLKLLLLILIKVELNNMKKIK